MRLDGRKRKVDGLAKSEWGWDNNRKNPPSAQGIWVVRFLLTEEVINATIITNMSQNKISVNPEWKNKILWQIEFQETYGLYPTCEICKKNLVYFSIGEPTLSVCWDTSSLDHSCLPIKVKCPSVFLAGCEPTEERIKLWKKCNFGLVCNIHNAKLGRPGYARRKKRLLLLLNNPEEKKWAKQALKYIERHRDQQRG